MKESIPIFEKSNKVKFGENDNTVTRTSVDSLLSKIRAEHTAYVSKDHIDRMKRSEDESPQHSVRRGLGSLSGSLKVPPRNLEKFGSIDDYEKYGKRGKSNDDVYDDIKMEKKRREGSLLLSFSHDAFTSKNSNNNGNGSNNSLNTNTTISNSSNGSNTNNHTNINDNNYNLTNYAANSMATSTTNTPPMYSEKSIEKTDKFPPTEKSEKSQKYEKNGNEKNEKYDKKTHTKSIREMISEIEKRAKSNLAAPVYVTTLDKLDRDMFTWQKSAAGNDEASRSGSFTMISSNDKTDYRNQGSFLRKSLQPIKESRRASQTASTDTEDSLHFLAHPKTPTQMSQSEFEYAIKHAATRVTDSRQNSNANTTQNSNVNTTQNTSRNIGDRSGYENGENRENGGNGNVNENGKYWNVDHGFEKVENGNEIGENGRNGEIRENGWNGVTESEIQGGLEQSKSEKDDTNNGNNDRNKGTDRSTKSGTHDINGNNDTGNGSKNSTPDSNDGNNKNSRNDKNSRKSGKDKCRGVRGNISIDCTYSDPSPTSYSPLNTLNTLDNTINNTDQYSMEQTEGMKAQALDGQGQQTQTRTQKHKHHKHGLESQGLRSMSISPTSQSMQQLEDTAEMQSGRLAHHGARRSTYDSPTSAMGVTNFNRTLKDNATRRSVSPMGHSNMSSSNVSGKSTRNREGRTSLSPNGRVKVNLEPIVTASKVPINIMGCHQPVELILAKADDRIRKQTQANSTREEGNAKFIRTVNSNIQEKYNRQENRIQMKLDEQRRVGWLRIIAIVMFNRKMLSTLPMSVAAANTQKKKKHALWVISRYLAQYRMRKTKDFKERFTALIAPRRHCFVFLIRLWRVKRAVVRVKDFLIECSKCTTQGFSAMYVRRFMACVKYVQRKVRTFLTCKRARVAALQKIWDVVEYQFVKAMLKPPRRKSVTKDAPSKIKSGRNPYGTRDDNGNYSNSEHNTSRTSGTTSSVFGTSGSTMTRKDAKLAAKWADMDSKFQEFMKRSGTTRHVDAALISRYKLPDAIKLPYLRRIIEDARRVLVLKCQEAHFKEAELAKKMTTFSLDDASDLLKGNDRKLLGLISRDWKNLTTSAPATLHLPFVLYSLLDPDTIFRAVRQAHEENDTFHGRDKNMVVDVITVSSDKLDKLHLF